MLLVLLLFQLLLQALISLKSKQRLLKVRVLWRSDFLKLLLDQICSLVRCVALLRFRHRIKYYTSLEYFH